MSPAMMRSTTSREDGDLCGFKPNCVGRFFHLAQYTELYAGDPGHVDWSRICPCGDWATRTNMSPARIIGSIFIVGCLDKPWSFTLKTNNCSFSQVDVNNFFHGSRCN